LPQGASSDHQASALSESPALPGTALSVLAAASSVLSAAISVLSARMVSVWDMESAIYDLDGITGLLGALAIEAEHSTSGLPNWRFCASRLGAVHEQLFEAWQRAVGDRRAAVMPADPPAG
jgi:hypothetical protein